MLCLFPFENSIGLSHNFNTHGAPDSYRDHLWHTFSTENKYVASQGTTNNLMDYSNNATSTDLYKYQWDYIHNPEFVIFRGDDEEGEFNFIIEPILKSIREANLKKESNLKLSVRAGSYKTADVSLNSYLLKYIGLDASGTAVEFLERKNREFTINPAEQSIETYTDESNVNCKKYTFHVVGKADVAFVMDVLESESKRFEDWLFSPYEISTEQLSSIYPTATPERVEAVTKAINKYCEEFEINTPERMAHFLGQIGAETGQKLEDLSESSSYSARRVVEIFGYNKYGHLFEEAELNEATYEYTYKPIDYSCTSCTGNSIDKGTSTFALTRSEILNAYAEVKAEKEVEVEGEKVKKMLFNETPRTDVVLKDGKIEQYVSNTMYNEGKLRVKQQYINSNTLFDVTYACRMDNGTIDSGDGSVYKGVGFIHLTGKGNYQSVVNTWNKMYPEDQLVLNHKLMEKAKTDVDLAMKLAMAYWKMRGINSMIGESYDENDVCNVNKLVNGSVDANGSKQKRITKTKLAYEKLTK